MNNRLLACLAALSLVACTMEDDADEGEATTVAGGFTKTPLPTSGFLSGSWTSPGFYTYPAKSMRFGATTGCTFGGGTVTVQALDVPNRFTVYDAYGKMLATTPWLGKAEYPGPWGSSLSSSSPSTATLSIPVAGRHNLVVETMVQAGGTTDAWEASWGSTSTNCGGATLPEQPACVDKLTASPMDGTYPAGQGYHVYPDRTFTVSYCKSKTISVTVNALDVPNRFNVYDPTGNLVASSDWVGSSKQPGPWGTMLYTNGTATLTFPSMNGVYRISVETVTSDRNDYWDARVY